MHARQVIEQIRRRNKQKFGRIIVVTGARQTGKTTLVRHAFGAYPYLSIEDPVLRQSYTQLSAEQWQANYPRAILDEVQKEPQLIESIKAVYDQYDDPRYILLGSSQLRLLHKVKESLAGRSQILELFPLTLPELQTQGWEDSLPESVLQQMLTGRWQAKNELPDFKLHAAYAQKIRVYDYYLQFGGYPALRDDNLSDAERWDWLRNYINTYLERDVRDLAEIRNLEPFVKIQRMVALHSGTLLNFSKLAKEAAVSSKTAQRYLQYLEMSYQAFVLQPWYKNEKKRLVRTPKVHWMDPGICNAILQKQQVLRGQEYESALIAEIYKQVKYSEVPLQMSHLRTSDGREVDLILETEAGYYAIEIKMTAHVRDTDARHLRGIEEILDKPVLQRIIISNDTTFKILHDKTICMHAANFLC